MLKSFGNERLIFDAKKLKCWKYVVLPENVFDSDFCYLQTETIPIRSIVQKVSKL